MQKDPKSNRGETLEEGSQSRTEKLRLESTKTGSRMMTEIIRLDFPAPLIKSIHNFLSNRSFRVRVDRILSSPRPIRIFFCHRSFHFTMARTKQTAIMTQPEALPEALVVTTRLPNVIKDKILKMEFVQSDTQMCEYLSLKWHLARAMKNGIGYLEKELELQ
ncbi:hypothetical protein TNCV_1765111 [Trichonephila clavipes]|nr:hypothetical protein TNCV_1765111 [Trichonephila clavipes]